MISAFTVITKPDERQYPWRESIRSVMAWADEIVIVDGSPKEIYEQNKKEFPTAIWIHDIWPDEWNWRELPIKFNKALNMCSGDWAIRFDVDYVYPDNWKEDLPIEINKIPDKRVANIAKISAITTTKWYSKGEFQYAINKKFKDTCFGESYGGYTDLLVPIVSSSGGEVPIGQPVSKDEIGRIRLFFYNYDYSMRTKECAKDMFYRMSMAHKRHFGNTPWGETPDESFDKFLDALKRRKERISIENVYHHDQPSFMQETLANLKPEQLGYNMWGLYE